MMTKDMLQSNTISFLRFPLIVGVVFIHSQLDDMSIRGVHLTETVGDFPFYEYCSYLISGILSRVAVPFFFFISGFLFFFRTNSFTSEVYCQKLKKRVKSIVIPYIFWNLLAITLLWLSQTFFTDLMSGQGKLVADYTFADWLWSFWNTGMVNSAVNSGFPICYQFWFIRDLIVTIIFAPIIYICVSKLKQYAVLILGVFWLWGLWFNVVGFSITAFFFFSAGAFFSITGRNFVDLMKPFLLISIISYSIIVILELCFKGWSWCIYLHNAGILIGVVGITAIVGHFIEKGCWKVNLFLSESSFFIYAFHALPLVFIIKFFFSIVQPNSDFLILMLYFLCPIIVIFVGLIIYFLLKKYCSKMAVFIMGGR